MLVLVKSLTTSSDREYRIVLSNWSPLSISLINREKTINGDVCKRKTRAIRKERDEGIENENKFEDMPCKRYGNTISYATENPESLFLLHLLSYTQPRFVTSVRNFPIKIFAD